MLNQFEKKSKHGLKTCASTGVIPTMEIRPRGTFNRYPRSRDRAIHNKLVEATNSCV
jgi:hypothetical protein